jgi:hypothetical protein
MGKIFSIYTEIFLLSPPSTAFSSGFGAAYGDNK